MLCVALLLISIILPYDIIAQVNIERSHIYHKEKLHSRGCPPSVWMPPIRFRADLGDILKQIGAKKGLSVLANE